MQFVGLWKIYKCLFIPNLIENKRFDWPSVSFFDHWPIRMLGLFPLFALNLKLFSALFKRKTALLLTNQNGEFFSCILLGYKPFSFCWRQKVPFKILDNRYIFLSLFHRPCFFSLVLNLTVLCLSYLVWWTSLRCFVTNTSAVFFTPSEAIPTRCWRLVAEFTFALTKFWSPLF